MRTTHKTPLIDESIERQNQKLKALLTEGKTINFLQAREIGIGHLHSRISDLCNKQGMKIYRRFIRIGRTNCKEYSLTDFLS